MYDVTASIDNKEIQNIKGLKDIVLHKESKLEISLRCLKVRNKDEDNKDARKIISNAVDIIPGKYTMSIVLSILNSTGSRKFLRSPSMQAMKKGLTRLILSLNGVRVFVATLIPKPARTQLLSRL